MGEGPQMKQAKQAKPPEKQKKSVGETAAAVYRFTATDEAPEEGFRRLCREIGKIDARAGARLLAIGLPDALTIEEACDVLRVIECERETWLVIDDFWLLGASLPPAFGAALLACGGAKLHVVVATQALDRDALAAMAGRGEGDVAEALAFHMRTQDYERVLSLDLSRVLFEAIGGTPFFEIALTITKRCPVEIRRAHPLSMLRVAWALKAAGKADQEEMFGNLMEELDGQLEASGPLRAEWLLLAAYRHFPRLDEMIPLLQRAEPMFEGACSRVILPEAPWAFGGYFQLTEFHLKVGEADREADSFEAFIDCYSRLTNGHGCGADALFRAELANLRGDMANAEIFAHKGAFAAEGKRQSIVQLGAAMILANIALWRTDTAGWQRAIDLMERVASGADRDTPLVRSVLDTVRGSLLVELGAQTRIADWLKNRDFPPGMLAPMILNALYVHGVFLLHEENFAQFVGMLEASVREVEGKSAYGEFGLPMLLAVGYASMGERDRAAEFFDLAAEKGLPDGFVMHFAGYSRLFPELIGDLIEKKGKKYPWLAGRFGAVKAQLDVGWKTLHDAVSKGDLPDALTVREREIARLAAGGLRNGEIAKLLCVTENTVRAHLRTIFQKLDIDRRAKLAARLNEKLP